MEKRQIAKQRHQWTVAACGLLMSAFALQGCQDDVLTGQPSWLGNSIYERSATPVRRHCLPQMTMLFNNGSPAMAGA